MEKTKSVQERILEISHKLKISKDGKNSYSGYDYFKPETIMAAIVPLLLEYKLFMKFDLTWDNEQGCYHGNLIIHDIFDKTEYLDSKEPKHNIEYFHFDIKEANVKGANPAMYSGATLTYCKRYMIMNAFNIADDKLDMDSDKMKEEEIKASKKEIAGVKVEEMKDHQSLINACKSNDELTKLYKTLTPYEQRYWKDKFTTKKTEFINSKIKNDGKDGNSNG